MNNCAKNLNFERAAELRDKIKAIKQLKIKQTVVSLGQNDQDVIALAKDSEYICFEVFCFVGGSLCDRETFFFDNMEEIEVSRAEFIQQYYVQKEKIPSKILVDGEVEGLEAIVQWLCQKAQKTIKITVPQKGNQAKILKMCQNNAKESLFQKNEYKNNKNSVTKDLQELLNLKNPPDYIEAYDISNLQGSDNVGAMVVFRGGKPLKSAYKKFKIKRILIQDDYGSMCEVLNRRFKEYEANKGQEQGFGKLPDLILLDGGKGHVSAAKKELEHLGYGSVPMFGMVKDSKHKTRAITSTGKEIDIKPNQKVFSFIFSIQEEVHRFAISYHKTRRKKTTISSGLKAIPGVGEKRAKLLLKHFNSFANIKKATIEEIEATPGLTKPAAMAVYRYFNVLHGKVD
jgi:excinuclease ABC subunit C